MNHDMQSGGDLPIGDFECLYARTYMQISSNYPNICPQEMGIISEMGH
jgi:hypothetical protein